MTFKLNWSYLKWYFPAIHNEYPEYTIDAAEVCSKVIHFYNFLISYRTLEVILSWFHLLVTFYH